MTEDARQRPRIAICFFGITRSLSQTHASIVENVLKPAEALGDVTRHGHFFQQDRVDNARSDESHRIVPDEHLLLELDSCTLEPTAPHPVMTLFEQARAYGNSWNDTFGSLRNLCHQLHSLKCVTDAALASDPDMTVFVRPDLEYLDSLDAAMKRALKSRLVSVTTPDWQTCTGRNDRFAITYGRSAALAYGTRIDRALDYCQSTMVPLHSERLLAYATRGLKYYTTSCRAVRVRASGQRVDEAFQPDFWSSRRALTVRRLKRLRQHPVRVLGSFISRRFSRTTPDNGSAELEVSK